MNRDEIIRMAHEAGVPMEYKFVDGATHWIVHPTLERFAALVAAAEREACAVTLETEGGAWNGESFEIAGAIRARTNQGE